MPTAPYTWEICDADGNVRVSLQLKIDYYVKPWHASDDRGPEEGGEVEVSGLLFDVWEHRLLNRVIRSLPLITPCVGCALRCLFEAEHDLEAICREHAEEQERQLPRNKWEARGD